MYEKNQAAWETLDDLSTAKINIDSILIDKVKSKKGKSISKFPESPGTTPLNTGNSSDGKTEVNPDMGPSSTTTTPLTTQKGERYVIWVDPNGSHIYRPTVDTIERQNLKLPEEKISVQFFKNGEEMKQFFCSNLAEKLNKTNTHVLVQRNIPADKDEAAGEAIYMILKKGVPDHLRDLPLVIYGKNLEPLQHLHEPSKRVYVCGDDGFVFAFATFQPLPEKH